MLDLLFVALCVILRGDLFYVLPFVILFLCFSVPLVLRLPCLCVGGGGGGGRGVGGGDKAYLSAYRTFVRFALVWFCLFPLPLGICEVLRYVIVPLPGLFSYPFFHRSY